ncbi:MAG: peptidylprolyl isomerase [Clostridia bacterium]|nr:peptidylprolyl isomerase [Clostridia bacterium]
MAFKKLGRLMIAVALTGAALAAPMLTGCNTDHPEAEITIQYDGVDYVLQYKMYRNMYPQTVKHFIELADNDFFDNTIIHNYQSSYWYGGGYTYSENEELSYAEAWGEGETGMLNYLEKTSKEGAYYDLADPAKGKITPSVYRNFLDGNYIDPLNTLIGEFSENKHKIDNGALKGSYGALRMSYFDKSDEVGKTYVYLDKQGSQKGVQGEYRYNCATSLFSIQVSTSTSSDSRNCIFATLQNEDTLKNLRTAVQKKSNTTSVSLYVDNYDELVGGANVNESKFSVQKTPIVIKSVVITKY